MALASRRRRDVVLIAAVLIVGDEEDGVLPVGAGRRTEGAERTALRCILKIVGPGDAVLVEEIEDCAPDGLVACSYK